MLTLMQARIEQRSARGCALVASMLVIFTPCPAAGADWSACGPGGRARCAEIAVPLDPADPGGDQVRLFVKHRRASERSERTIVALAGGPGESASALFDTFEGTVGREARRRLGLAVFDVRGTGRSDAVVCRRLQNEPYLPSSAGADECARTLGAHRSHYTTSHSVSDLHAVLDALGVRRAVLYGTSYGTKLALAFARRHPDRVSRLLLDSVVGLDGPSALDLQTFAALPRVLGDQCRKRCRGITRDLTRELSRLVERLRHAPLTGKAYDRVGRARERTIDRRALLELLLHGDEHPAIRAGLPAAIAAANRDDPAMLLRLYRQMIVDHSASLSVERFSAGIFVATSCEELIFPWSPLSEPSARAQEATSFATRLTGRAFGPFDAETALSRQFVPLCLRWRGGTSALPEPPPDVPALIISGTQDLRTPTEDGRAISNRMPRARLLRVPGAGHSVLTDDGADCAVRAARAFLVGRTGPGRCDRIDPGLPPRRPPTSLRSLRPVRGVAGARGRILRALGLTLADVRYASTVSGADGGGLRGGWFRRTRRGFRLRTVEYVPGVRVSATPRRGGRLEVQIRGPNAIRGRVEIAADGRASGRLGGRRVQARIANVSADA
jgi:pimeloyl-ACP methyl ester carboxylesterase